MPFSFNTKMHGSEMVNDAGLYMRINSKMKTTGAFIFIFLAFTGNAQPGGPGLRDLSNRRFIVTSANPQLKGTFLNHIVIGNNYRREWTDSIRVPVLNFTRDFKELVIEKEGGGRQTHTLHLKEGPGEEWVLRSVKKFPEKVISPQLRGTIAEKLVVDGISASYPFSVLSVGTLATAAGVPYFPNAIVYWVNSAQNIKTPWPF